MRAHEFIIEAEVNRGRRAALGALGLGGLAAGLGTAGSALRDYLGNPRVSDEQKAAVAAKAGIPPAQLPPNVAEKLPPAEPAAEPPRFLERAHPRINPITDNPNERLLKRFAEANGIRGIELAAFMAQCAHETRNFTKMEEMASGRDYEPVFRKDAQGRLIVDPKTGKPKNFNATAAKLGNIQRGDGERFKGRGYIQLTGRWNYGQASRGVFGDDRLLEQPWLAEDPKIAAYIAVWYWENRVRRKVDDFRDVRAVTYPINSGLRGLEKRDQLFNQYLSMAR